MRRGPGADATRERKLLKKQRAHKKRMRQCGTVEIPQEALALKRWGMSDQADLAVPREAGAQCRAVRGPATQKGRQSLHRADVKGGRRS
jgi:hypothetical protein